MQTVLLRLDALIRRRRRSFLAVWALAVLAAMPFAAKQADHLTGGGFDVPGSQSVAVQKAVVRDFQDVQATTLAVVLVPWDGATNAQETAALARVEVATRDAKDVALAPAARTQALRELNANGRRSIQRDAR